MERLTARNENGEKEAYYPHCMREDTCDGDGASEKCDGCDFAQKVCETLASYEETGLAPEQIWEIDLLYAEKCREAAELRQRDIAKEPQYEGNGYHEGDITRSSQDNNGWIPADERLPKVDKMPETDDECPEFNVTIQGAKEATTLKYSPFDDAWFDDNGYVYPVIAWRPLPKPYRLER